MGRFLECPWGAKKSMDVSPGRQRDAKNATTLGQTLTEGDLLEKMAPRARLVRAQLINKLIKLIN